jgi:SAM-dependent methyltransferase
MAQPYTHAFFEHHAERSLDSARAILPEVFAVVPARTVVDIGCGRGTWLQAAKALGARDVIGVDGAHVDPATLVVAADEFVPCSLEDDFVARVASRGRRRFDLLLCLEVAEHLPYHAASAFVERLTWLSDAILFSAAVPFQSGTSHVNEQWPEFWALHFKTHGYGCRDVFRTLFWDRADVEWWYAQNLLLFVRRGTPTEARLPAAARREAGSLSLVHPENYLFQILYTFRQHRAAAREEEIEDLRRLRDAWRSGASQLPDLASVARAAAAPADARDVFPYTRTQLASPEAELSRRLRAEERVAALEATVRDLRVRLAETERELAASRESS